MRSINTGILLFAVSAGLAAGGIVRADSAQQEVVERGNAHYLVFCANCHGTEADGQGRLVDTLAIAVPGLTFLKASGCDEKVTERVLKASDGRHAITQAGGRKMPAFNENLEIGTIIEISEYLKTIQE
jgi:hypothetical protein